MIFLVDLKWHCTLFSPPYLIFQPLPPSVLPLSLSLPALPHYQILFLFLQSCKIGAKQEMNRWEQNLSRDILENGHWDIQTSALLRFFIMLVWCFCHIEESLVISICNISLLICFVFYTKLSPIWMKEQTNTCIMSVSV